MLLAFFSWWYGRGWHQVLTNFRPRLQGVADNFSVTQLLRTLFAPWRRIITPPGRSLEDKLRAFADNMFSRVIGFIVRLVVIFTAFICLVAIAIATIVEIITWPLLPLAVPVLIVMGVTA